MLLKNKTAVITGSNKGIGKEIIKVFSENGANIFACARNVDQEFQSDINLLKKNYNNEIIPIKLDLAEESQIKDAATKIISYEKPIDILINNAATIHTSLFQMTSKKKLEEIFKINFFSQTIFTQYILKSMIRKKNGSIIYISSSSAIDGNEGRSAYVASKAAVNSQAKVLSREIGTNNIRVNVIAPGLTNTDMMSKNTPKNIIEDTVSRISLRRVGEPNEIAKVALFLGSDMSNYVTGQVIRVDGGM
jgi:3-oxoacyl-[acyl-carrier protein] reductase|tara:strand:+ start:349 stop:1092 length:744 start_codon:yes stop_codon:yes gene_type:complete